MKRGNKSRIIDDKVYLYSKVPTSKNLLIQEAVYSGLQAARVNLRTSKKVKIRIWVLARIKGGMPSRAATNKKFISIGITRKYLNSRNIYKNLAGTVIHEYIHFLRLHSGRHRAKTILDAVIEEGIAIYIQSAVAKPPNYLDIKTLDEKMIKICWDKFSEVIDKPIKKRYWNKIENNEIYRAIYYRLGFGIVRRFMELNPGISLAKLVRISEKKLARFAHIYRKGLK